MTSNKNRRKNRDWELLSWEEIQLRNLLAIAEQKEVVALQL